MNLNEVNSASEESKYFLKNPEYGLSISCPEVAIKYRQEDVEKEGAERLIAVVLIIQNMLAVRKDCAL